MLCPGVVQRWRVLCPGGIIWGVLGKQLAAVPAWMGARAHGHQSLCLCWDVPGEPCRLLAVGIWLLWKVASQEGEQRCSRAGSASEVSVSAVVPGTWWSCCQVVKRSNKKEEERKADVQRRGWERLAVPCVSGALHVPGGPRAGLDGAQGFAAPSWPWDRLEGAGGMEWGSPQVGGSQHGGQGREGWCGWRREALITEGSTATAITDDRPVLEPSQAGSARQVMGSYLGHPQAPACGF